MSGVLHDDFVPKLELTVGMQILGLEKLCYLTTAGRCVNVY